MTEFGLKSKTAQILFARRLMTRFKMNFSCKHFYQQQFTHYGRDNKYK